MGGVGVIAGVVVGMQAKSDANDANKQVGKTSDGQPIYQAGAQKESQDATSKSHLSTIFSAIGGVAILGGAAAWFFSGSSGDTKTALAPVVTGDSVGFALSGRF